MKRNDLLAQLSLISLLLLSLHLPDDYVHGFDKHVVDNPYPILIFVVWACGLLLLRERLLGRIILLLGGVAAVAMPIIHLNGHIPPEFAASDGAFRFVWTLYALGTLGTLTIIVALRELFGGRQARGGSPAGDP
ncbi:MAG TPA: hypothetical protein VJO52_16525 [Gemmatimonadaceae bacterium]|nr:hypothetical protein [Gemmatimonadaceae bacterium]